MIKALRTILFSILVLAAGVPVHAADRVTATVTITNAAGTINGNTFTLNGSTRTWTNTVVTPASQILTNNSIGGVTTNLWFHVAQSQFPQVTAVWVATNRIAFSGGVGVAMTVSFGGTWATNAYSTQTVATVDTVRVPMSALPNAVRTNDATRLVTGLNDYSQLPILPASTVAGQLVGTTNTQTLSGKKTWTGSNVFALIVTTNLVNYGNAISSPGSGTDSEEFGSGAVATNVNALAVGFGATAYGVNSIALGNGATAPATGQNQAAMGNFASATRDSGLAVGNGAAASAPSAVAIGASAAASGTNSVALGTLSGASGAQAIAIGDSAEASFTNSVAIGYTADTSAANQIRLGTAVHTVSVLGILSPAVTTNSTYYGTVGLLSGGYLSGVGATNFASTNATFKGTNVFSGVVQNARANHTALANGNNAGIDFGSAVFVKIKAGPTAAFTLNGIAGGTDGRVLVLYNAVAQNMTIANDSGVDPTAANRIYTLTGGDVTTTGIAAVTLRYDSEDSRWIMISIRD